MTHSSSGGGSSRLRGRVMTGAARYSSITGRYRWRSLSSSSESCVPVCSSCCIRSCADCRDTPKMSHISSASRSLPRCISSPVAAVGISRLAAKAFASASSRTPSQLWRQQMCPSSWAIDQRLRQLDSTSRLYKIRCRPYTAYACQSPAFCKDFLLAIPFRLCPRPPSGRCRWRSGRCRWYPENYRGYACGLPAGFSGCAAQTSQYPGR